MNVKERKMRMVYVCADYLSTIVGVIAFTFVRYFFVDDIRERYAELFAFFGTPGLKLTFALFPLFMLLLYYLSGYYVNVTYKSRVTEFLSTVISVAIGAFSFFMVVLLNDVLPKRTLNYEILLIFALCLFVPVYLTRLIVTTIQISSKHGGDAERIIVVTDVPSRNNRLCEIEKILSRSRKKIVSIIELPTVGNEDFSEGNLSENHLREKLEKHNATAFVVIVSGGNSELMLKAIGCLYFLDCPIYVSPDDYMILVSKVPYDNLMSEPLVDISKSLLSDSVVSLKRASDIVVAFFGLVVAAPVIAILAVVIKLKSPGPIFYSQERIGYHRKPFQIHKLRTMKIDAEADGPMLSTDDDPRVTSIGRIMRKYRLDELPNLWNVLKGDMSLVGPRPEREHFLSQLRRRAPHCALLHQVRPGLTSLGMVKFGYASTLDDMLERLKYDILYIQNISVTLDLKVLFYTIRTIFKGEGK